MAEAGKSKIKSLFKKIRIEYLIVIALAIVALIIIFNAFSSKGGDQTATGDDVEKYVSDLEAKLGKCLSKVDGAGEVTVIISVASGREEVYAVEKITGDKGVTESPVVVGGKPIVVKENNPEITGVVIVADGAKNLSVKVNLLNACKVFLSIDESKIKVLSSK